MPSCADAPDLLLMDDHDDVDSDDPLADDLGQSPHWKPHTNETKIIVALTKPLDLYRGLSMSAKKPYFPSL